MRTMSAVALAIALMVLIQTDVAQAQNYPWCAQYSLRGGPRNCGFVSWQQCMATVSGIGGYCERNPMYRPDNARPVRHKARRRH